MRQSSDGGSSNQKAFGGGLGYRVVVRQSLGLRFEARYRHWSLEGGESLDEIGLLVGFGAVIGR